ncbi:MAG: hypothetical protein K0Q87_1004 [Neobacillus sp.]|jgi:hypothetical protein|nr:hypothetical protein [Neobacillus sp.]
MEETNSGIQFTEVYIERCSKESETMISNETVEFLSHPLVYLKEHKEEFIYLESHTFEQIRVDAVSLEADDVFGTYDVMLGLKLQKKVEKMLKEKLETSLLGDGAKFDLIFSQDDGLWNLNFALDYVEGFQENITLGAAFQLIYQFLSDLVEAVKTLTSK